MNLTTARGPGPLRGIDALLFDYGGVVFHEDPADYDAIGAPHGFAAGELWALVHGVPEYPPSRTGDLSREAYESAVHRHLQGRLGGVAADQVVEALLALYRIAPVRPLMQTLLPQLRGQLPIALLSNATRGSTQRLAERGVAALFDVVLCSGDIGVAKPDPAVFRHACERLQVAPACCALIDDQRANIDAAIAFGMQGWLYHHRQHQACCDWLARCGLQVDAATPDAPRPL